jgi:hypothetical protein
MLAVQPQYVCRTLELQLGTYYRDLGRVALLAGLYQFPLLIYTYSVTTSLMINFIVAGCYYPVYLLVLFHHVLSGSDRLRLGRAVPALRMFL